MMRTISKVWFGSMVPFLKLVFLGLAAAMASGCGSQSMPARTIEKDQQLFEDAVSRLSSRDFSGAKQAAQEALQGGGLSADQASEASMILIEAAIETGDLTQADAELTKIEKVAMDMARVYLLRGKLARKQGNEAAAQEAFTKAKAEDPNVVIPN